MKYIIAVLFCFSASLSIAQDAVIPRKYFDQYWQRLPDSNGATFYRIAEKKDSLFLVHDYYVSGKLQMEALCSRIEPKLTTAGTGTLYYESGGKQQVGRFENEEPVGLHSYYTALGKLKCEIFHNGKEKKYYSYYSSEDVNLIPLGTGLIQESLLSDVHYIEIVDSLLVASYAIRNADTIYHVCDKQPEYKGGATKMMQELVANLVYPKPARRQGVEGKVYIEMIISKEGRIQEATVLKGIHTLCDKASLAAARELNNWNPATHKGKPVLSKAILPVAFRLK